MAEKKGISIYFTSKCEKKNTEQLEAQDIFESMTNELNPRETYPL